MTKSIRFRFTFMFTLFVIIIVCLFSMMLFLLYTHQVRQNIEKSLVFAIEQSIQSFFDQNKHFHIHEQENPSEISQFIAVNIYDKQKLLYSSHTILSVPYPVVISKYQETSDGKFVMLAKPFITPHQTYIIQALYLQTPEQEKLYKLILTLISLIICCLFISVIGAWYLSFKLLAPFRQIAENASRISAKNLNERLSYKIETDEVGQLCVTLNKLFSHLQNSFETLKKFTSNASHELKTPLTIMRGDIEVLLRKKRTPEEYEKTLLCTIDEIQRMDRLIQGLLLLAQAEGEKILTASYVAVADLVEIAKNNLTKIYKSKEIQITENIDYDVYVCGNPIWIQQIIENLLNNAFQNTPAQGDILISLHKHQNYAYLTIQNSGEGIAPEHLPFIFDRFYHVNSHVNNNKGFGLGLAICKALAEKHDGYIQVKSVPGETVFTLCLPITTEKTSKFS